MSHRLADLQQLLESTNLFQGPTFWSWLRLVVSIEPKNIKTAGEERTIEFVVLSLTLESTMLWIILLDNNNTKESFLDRFLSACLMRRILVLFVLCYTSLTDQRQVLFVREDNSSNILSSLDFGKGNWIWRNGLPSIFVASCFSLINLKG